MHRRPKNVFVLTDNLTVSESYFVNIAPFKPKNTATFLQSNAAAAIIFHSVLSNFGNACCELVKIAINTPLLGWYRHHHPIRFKLNQSNVSENLSGT